MVGLVRYVDIPKNTREAAHRWAADDGHKERVDDGNYRPVAEGVQSRRQQVSRQLPVHIAHGLAFLQQRQRRELGADLYMFLCGGWVGAVVTHCSPKARVSGLVSRATRAIPL